MKAFHGWLWLAAIAIAIPFGSANALQIDANAVLVDVREWDEIKSGIALGAFWLPSSTLQQTPNKLLSLLPKKSELLVYCRSGARAKRAVEFLTSQGFRAKNIGAFADLKAAGIKTSVITHSNEASFLLELEVERYLQSLNAMREGLASTLKKSADKITEADFKQVCAPVGKALMAWATENSYDARQVSTKNRNPKNSPTTQEAAMLKAMEAEPSIKKIVERSTRDESSGFLVGVRIPVAQACLKCHGSPEARPLFIKEKYPEDKAHGFREGDLRGMYSVFVPDSKTALQNKH